MRGLVRIHPVAKRGGEVRTLLHMLAPCRVRAVLGMHAAVVDLGQRHQQIGDGGGGGHP